MVLSSVCDVLGLTWVLFLVGFYRFSHLRHNFSKKFFMILPLISSFYFKEGVQIVADLALHEVWFCACSFINFNSPRTHFHYDLHCYCVEACFTEYFLKKVNGFANVLWNLMFRLVLRSLFSFGLG